ncbi:MAG: hypothetical protein KAU21_12085, partial [Gammaproteobacteria bacterium]|nr:hypothetical protein [Gammaproteobacteria bacterium]
MKKIIQSMLFVAGMVSVLLIGSCASSSIRSQLTEPYPVWPSSPAETKIELVNVFSQPEDLNIGKGFWQQISELFLGSDIEDMVRPMAVVVRNEQQIYVTDPGVHGVHLFDLKEQDYKLIKLPGHREMLSPIALALSGTEDILITDSK